MNKSPDSKNTFLTAAVTHNPVLIEAIGLAPILAVAVSAKSALLLSVLTACSLFITTALTSTVLKKFPNYIRMPFYLLIGTQITVSAMWLAQTFFPEFYVELGLFLPLTAVSSLIALHCERFALKADIKESMIHAGGTSVGYCAVTLITGIIREILSQASVFDIKLNISRVSDGFALPFFAFVIFGFMAAILKARLGVRYENEDAEKAFMKHSVMLEGEEHISTLDVIAKKQKIYRKRKSWRNIILQDKEEQQRIREEQAYTAAQSEKQEKSLPFVIREQEYEQTDYLPQQTKTELRPDDIEEELIEIDKVLRETLLGKNNTSQEIVHIQESKKIQEEAAKKRIEAEEKLRIEKEQQEKQKAEELEKQRLEQELKEKQRAQEEERRRLEQELREKQMAREKERRRLEQELREKQRAEELERRRLEQERKERQKAEELERRRLEQERKERQKAEELEKQRLELELREKQKAEELERRRLEQERKERQEAEELEKQRLELEAKKAQELERQRLEQEAKEKKKAQELEKQRLELEAKKAQELERQRLQKEAKEKQKAQELEKQRLEAERRKVEAFEKRRLIQEEKEKKKLLEIEKLRAKKDSKNQEKLRRKSMTADEKLREKALADEEKRRRKIAKNAANSEEILEKFNKDAEAAKKAAQKKNTDYFGLGFTPDGMEKEVQKAEKSNPFIMPLSDTPKKEVKK